MIRIDSDSHFTPLDAFAEVDPRYAEIGPHFEILPSGRYKVIYRARDPFVPQHIKPLREKGHSASDLDPAPRIDAMAQDGFDMQVLIPNNAPFYYDVDGAMGASVSRSFNRSIARILRRYPNKFIGIATAPLQNIDLAIAETEYAIKELGLHAVIIYQNVNRQDLNSEFLWPFYECVEGLGVPFWFTV
jgi:predicted TIM-barrel fold metal-dependent hydrolase